MYSPELKPEVRGRRRDIITAACLALFASCFAGIACMALLAGEHGLFPRLDGDARRDIGLSFPVLFPSLTWLWFGVIRPFRSGAAIHFAGKYAWKTGDRDRLVWRADDPDEFMCLWVGHVVVSFAGLALGTMLLLHGLHKLEKSRPAPNPPAAEDAGFVAPFGFGRPWACTAGHARFLRCLDRTANPKSKNEYAEQPF